MEKTMETLNTTTLDDTDQTTSSNVPMVLLIANLAGQ